MRSGRWPFDRGDNLAGAIYGTILVTSLVAAADGQDEIWRSLGIVEVTVVVSGSPTSTPTRSGAVSTAARSSRLPACGGSQQGNGRFCRRRSSRHSRCSLVAST